MILLSNDFSDCAQEVGAVRYALSSRFLAGLCKTRSSTLSMGKYKPAGSRKPGAEKSNARAIPCLIVVLLAIAIVSFLFYEILQSGN